VPILLTPQNIVYYRLKQVDMDDSFSYSKTVALDNSIKSTFVLYPNPSSDVLSIQFISKGAQTVDFKLVNMLGQTVQSHSYDTTEGDNQLNLNIFTLPKGQYIVSIKEGTLVTFKKFVKN
jgi:fructose-1,6-bisphosphatase